MRIGVDATSWGNTRGYGRFARNALACLVATDTATTYVMIGPPDDAPSLPAGSDVLRLPRGTGVPRSADAARPPRELGRLARAAHAARIDAMLFPSVYTWFPTPGIPTAVGIHDAIAATLPGLTLPSRQARAMWAVKEAWAVRSAARVFTVSAASRKVVTRRWRLPAERVAIVPEAPAEIFFPRPAPAIAPHLEALGLEAGEPYLLFAGGISPHKNLHAAVGALARLRDRGEPVPRLVAVGDLEDDRFLSSTADVRRRIDDLGLAGHVLLPGFVSDEALACLYSGATAVVLPSLAEGFGLPAVEAAACGAPLVLSDLPAHRETLDGAALFAPPRDEAALAAALQRVAGDPALRMELGERARQAVAPLSWEAAAAVLRELLHGLPERR